MNVGSLPSVPRFSISRLTCFASALGLMLSSSLSAAPTSTCFCSGEGSSDGSSIYSSTPEAFAAAQAEQRGTQLFSTMSSNQTTTSTPELFAAMSSNQTTTSTTELWNDYVADPDAHSHLPNCSYAGYRRGEVPIPNVPVVTSILDHGGVADGTTDNSEAFRLAIDAAYYAGGGAVEIPAGTYAVDDLIVLYRPGVVLRGAGMGQTTIKFTNPLLDVLGNPDPGGNARWNWMGGLLWVGAREKSQFRRNLDDNMIYNPVYPLYINRGDGPKELWHYTEALTDVTSVNEEGDDTITVADASGLRAGETILISYFNPEDLSLLHEIGKHPLMKDPSVDWGEWLINNGTDIHGWYRLYWPVEIQSISGNEITLEQSLRLRTASEWQCQIHGMGDIVSEAGVEDLTIEGNAGASLAHNGGPGWNGMFFNQALNCWAKNVEVVNMENGFHISSCKGISLENTEVRGDRPMHHPYTTRQNSQDCFINNFVIDLTGVPAGGDPPVKHGINTEAFSAGNVWTRGTMSHGTFDSHRAVSYDYLRTDIDVANDEASGPGGNDKSGPYVGRRVVHWNVRIDSDMAPADEGLYIYQPEALTFGALVGIQGAQMNTDAAWAMPVGDKDVIVLDHNTIPFIPNLYDAQFDLRRDNATWAHLANPIVDFHPKGNIQLKASVNPGAGRTVDTVEYYANGSYIGSSSNGPEYSFNWNSVDYGYFQMQVKMIADNNAVTWSVPYDLTVGNRVKVEENSSLLVWNNAELETYADESTHSGGSYVKVKGADAYVDLPFKGTRAKIYVRHDKQDQSAYVVYIDDMINPVLGNTAATGEDANQYLLYDTGTLPDGSHTLRIDTGDYPRMYIDFIELWITEDAVVGGNSAPVANNDSATMDLNSSASIAVLSNDSDADGDTLSISSYTQGTNGSVNQSGNNLIYTPDNNYSGSDSFTYVVSDGIGSDTGTVNVNVISGGNNAPVANNDNSSTPKDTAISIAVLSNDTDADGDSLFISSFTSPLNGSVSQSGSELTYTPNSGYTGADSFNYTVSDGNDTDTATVSVDVYDAGSQIPFGNGGDPWPVPGTVEAENFDVGGNGIAYYDVSSLNSGDSTYRSGTDGSSVDLQVTNDPSGGGAHIHWFDAGEWLEYTVDVAQSGTYTVSVRYATNENTAGYTLDVDGSEIIPSTSLPNSGGWSVWTTHELVGVSLTSGTHVLRFNRLGARFKLNWITFTFEGSSNAAPVANDDSATMDQDSSLSIAVLSNDTDADGDNLSISSYGQGSNGSVSQSGNDLVYTPNSGYFGSDSFSYTVSDGNDTDTATVSVTVNQAAGGDTIDLNAVTITSFANQDSNGTYSVSGDGTTISLTGNTWKKIDFPYDITSDTILEFEIRVTTEGEVHCIGFDTDNSLNGDENRSFQVHGTQNWGKISGYNNYSGSDWVSYSIPVGNHITGSFIYLLLINDDDANNAAQSEIRNIRVYEDGVGGGDTTPPGAPSNLTATATGTSTIDLNWSNNGESDFDHYAVYRGTSSGSHSLIDGNVSSSSYSDSGLSDDTTYYYVVTAVDTSGNESSASSEASATTDQAADTTPPGAPTNLTATATGTSSIDLNWNNNGESDFDHYAVYRGTSSGSHSLIDGNVSGSSYSDSGLSDDTTYYYVVTAVDTSDNESSASSEASATTDQAGGGDTIDLNAVTITSFANQDSNGTYSVSGDGTTISLTGNTWKKVDFAYNITSDTILEFEIRVTTEGEVHGIGFDTDNSLNGDENRSFQVHGTQNWGKISGYNNYSGSDWVSYSIPVGNHITGSFIYLLLINDDDANNAAQSEIRNIRVYEDGVGGGDTTPPGAPSNLTATATGTSTIDLNWSNNGESDFDHYAVYRGTSSGSHSLIDGNVSGSSYNDSGLSVDTTYYYVVTAVDTSGNESSASSESSATTDPAADTTPPGAPSNLTATATGTSTIDLNWSNNGESDFDHYAVYRGTSSGSHSLIDGNVSGSSYSDSGLSDDTTYYYVVTAVDTSGNESSASSEASATTDSAGGGSGDTIDFSASSVTSYSDQDNGTYSVLDSGATLRLQGNSWKKVPFTYSVTSNTVIVVEIRTTDAGELIGLSLDEDNDHSNNGGRVVVLGGSQSVPSDMLNGTDLYTPSDSFVEITIPIGSFASGYTSQYLGLVGDDDGNSATDVYFRNLRVQESTAPVEGFTPVVSSYLDTAGDDEILATLVQSDGTIVIVGNFGSGDIGGVTPDVLVGASSSSSGAVVLLNAGGTSVIQASRIADSVGEADLDGADNIIVAGMAAGVIKVNPSGTSILWSALTNGSCRRVDAADDGTIVAHDGSGTDSGTVYTFDSTGVNIASWGGFQKTTDVAIDDVNSQVYMIGYENKNTSCNPVQVAFLRAVDYYGVEQWRNYDWPSSVMEPNCPDPNITVNNMADTRGYRVFVADDGYLYGAFESAGGNDIFRWDPKDLNTAVPLVGFDEYSQFSNAKSEHKTVFIRFNPLNGDHIVGSRLTARLTTGAANALRVANGNLMADSQGRIYLTGVSGSGGGTNNSDLGLPFSYNPVPCCNYYGGGPFLMVLSADMSERKFLGRFTGSGTSAMGLGIHETANGVRVVVGAAHSSGSGYFEAINALQSTPAGGEVTFFGIIEEGSFTGDVEEWVSQDIGNVGAAGNSVYDNTTGVFTIEGSGADIWNSSDEFHFTHIEKSGDFSIVARVVSVENTHEWAKAGVMIRDSLNPDSTHASMVMTPGNGASFQRRTSTGSSSLSNSLSGETAPGWVRMERTGNILTASYSSDGISWNEVGSATITMADPVYVGLAVTSHNDGIVCTAEIDSVEVAP